MTALVQSNSTLSLKDYSSPSLYSCPSAQSLSSHWANYQLCIPPVNSFLTSDNDSFRVSSSVSLPSIGVLVKRGLLVDNIDDSIVSDDTPQADTFKHTEPIPKSEDPSPIQNSALTVIPANLNACRPLQTKPKQPKLGMSLSASTIWTDILDFSCSVSSFPTSFLFASWDNTAAPAPKARLSGLVSALPSSQALGSTASGPPSKLVQSDLPSRRSFTHSTNIPTVDTVSSHLSAAAVPLFSTSELKNTSTALNIVKKAKSNLKLITSRSLRNLAKINLKVSRTPDTIKPSNAESETTPRSLIPPLVGITAQSSRFSSWFSASGADLRASSVNTGSDVCYDSGPNKAVFSDDLTQCGITSHELPGLDSAGQLGNDNREQRITDSSSNLCIPDIQIPVYEKHRLRQNARTLRGLRREQIAAAQSYPALENDFEMFSLVSQLPRLFANHDDNENLARDDSKLPDATEDERHVLSRCPNNTPVKMAAHPDECALRSAEVNMMETAQLHPITLASGITDTASSVNNTIEKDTASLGKSTKTKKRKIWERLRLSSPAFKKVSKGTRSCKTPESAPTAERETKGDIKMGLRIPPSGEERTKLYYYDVVIERGRRRYERYLSKARKFAPVSSHSEMAC